MFFVRKFFSLFFLFVIVALLLSLEVASSKAHHPFMSLYFLGCV